MSEQQFLESVVNKLYEYRDNFIENVGVECVSQKTKLVKAEMEKTLANIKEQEGVYQKTQYLFLLGKTLNVMPEYSQECEDYLSKVVKRDPSHIEAWNMLGETFWKKGNLIASKDCFEGALKRKKDKISLRSLSMVLRQLKPKQPGNNQMNVLESVKHAKAAVELDVNDGKSWYILGNAYLSLFFVTEQNPKVLTLSLNAYSQAEKVDKSSIYNPDLHFNRAVACRYEQKYKLALEGFHKAAILDPSWPDPKERISELCKYLEKVDNLVQKKGKLPRKRLENLIKSNKQTDLGPYAGGSYSSNGKTVPLEPVVLSALEEGLNAEKVFLGRVVCNFADLTLVPFTIALVDRTGACCSTTIYNLAEGRGMIIGDAVAIPEPFVTHHQVEWGEGESLKRWKFTDIRVHNPVVLAVNGRKLNKNHCSYTKASMSASK